MVGDERREVITPLLTSSTTYGAPAHQQVMSPTRAATPVLEHETRVYSGSTLPPENAQSGAEGFEPRAAGRASGSAGQHESLQDSGEASQVSTTIEGGVQAHRSVGGLRLVLVLSSARRKPGLSCGRAQWLLQQPSNVPNSLV